MFYYEIRKVITSWNLIIAKNVKKIDFTSSLKFEIFFWNIFRFNSAWFGQILYNVIHGCDGFAFTIINGT